MIYSTLHSKETNEDLKTSSIIGAILLLPELLIYKIFNKACTPCVLPSNNGLITSFEFWPRWYDDSFNVNYVEPDVVVHCEFRDIIIEAKYGDTKGQNREQWQKEICAYKKEYGERKEVSFIAVGGNDNYDVEEIEGITIMKCSWTSLLMTVLSIRSQLEKVSFRDEHNSQIMRILSHIEQAFEAHRVVSLTPLDAISLTTYLPSQIDTHIFQFKI